MDKNLLQRIAAYCAYQERSPQEVRLRLRKWEVPPAEAEAMLQQLIEEGYLSQARFAESFTGGKMRVKRWGKIRIEQELRKRGVSGEDASRSLAGIDAGAYLSNLKILLEKKEATLKEPDARLRKQKLARYAFSKGYEPELVWRVLGQLGHPADGEDDFIETE